MTVTECSKENRSCAVAPQLLLENGTWTTHGWKQNMDLSKDHHSAMPGKLHLLSSSPWLKT